MDNRDFYIFGRPIKTKYGDVRFLSYIEYIENLNYLSIMSLNTLHFYYQHQKYFKQSKHSNQEQMEIDELLENIKKEKLYNLIVSNEQNLQAYFIVFSLVLGDKEKATAVLKDEDDFYQLRRLVLDMQMIQEEEVSENPEIQEFIDAGKEQRSLGSEKQTFSDIVSSIVVGAGLTYQQISELTVLQVYSTYYRIGQFRNYDTTTLYSTVRNEVSIEAWNKTIDLFKTEKSGMKMSEFKKKYGNLF